MATVVSVNVGVPQDVDDHLCSKATPSCAPHDSVFPLQLPSEHCFGSLAAIVSVALQLEGACSNDMTTRSRALSLFFFTGGRP